MKYYVFRFHKYFEFKRTKCTDHWSKSPEGCWQFSRQGAESIVNVRNERGHGFYQYGIVSADKVFEMLEQYEKQTDKETYMAEEMDFRPWWI